MSDRTFTQIVGGESLKREQDAAMQRLYDAEAASREVATKGERDDAACELLDAIAWAEEIGALGKAC